MKRISKNDFTGVLIIVGILLIAGFPGHAQRQGARLILATTTSTENSGLLKAILPVFEARENVRVDVVAVGTGAAIRLGKNGDADVVLVHDPHMEEEFTASGFGIGRKNVMYNDFVVLGPKEDPAGIRSARDAADAFRMIARSGADFVSRGDASGTHVKEKTVWEAAGLKPSGRWYKEAGQGMGAVITMADGLAGYTLSDRGTFISLENRISSVLLYEGDPVLFNPYGVIAVNPAKRPHVNYGKAEAFIRWLTGTEGRRLIGDYRIGDKQLFYPSAD